MNYDLNAAALFVKLVEFKSFSEVSRRLDVPISTVSRKITELETELGVRLLERSTRTHRLTELGQVFYERCRRGLEEFESGSLLIRDRQSQVSGTLRISAPPSLADFLIVPLICAFQSAYPEVAVKIFISERYVSFIEDGIDIALRVGELKDSSLVAKTLLRYRHLLVASPDYLRIHGSPDQPNDLTNHKLISFEGCYAPVSWKLSHQNKKTTIKVTETLAINDFAGIQFAVKSGHGIANIPAIICAQAMREQRLVEVLPEWKLAPTQLSIVHPSSRNVSRMVHLFNDFCAEQIGTFVPFTGI